MMDEHTINEQNFEDFLKRGESDILDFKSTAPKITYEPDQARFIKDIICMANTPRDEPAYIIYGVNKHPDGTYDLPGLDKYIDPEILQSQFAEERVYPIPYFTYSTVHYEGKTFGVIRVPPVRVGVCRPRKDFFSIMKQHHTYFRRDAKNALALPEDISIIVEWMKIGQVPCSEPSFLDDEWEKFLEAVYRFDPLRRYILLTTPFDAEQAKTVNISAIGGIPASMVFDFDPDSETGGLLKLIKDPIEKQQRHLHLVVPRNKPTIYPDGSMYWIFARGLRGLSDTIKVGPYDEWKKYYGRDLRGHLERLEEKISPVPITCIALWYDTGLVAHLRAMLDDILTIMGSAVNIIIATNSPSDLQTLQGDIKATLVNIPFHQLCSGLQDHFATTIVPKEVLRKLPSSSGAPQLLDSKTKQWLEEELELVDLSQGLEAPFQDYCRRDFLRGSETEIHWYGLDKGYDVDRDKLLMRRNELEDPLRRKRTVRVNLYHEAGAGGTTLARRLLWDLHMNYPSAILRRCNPVETAERLYRLASLTGKGILLLIDGGQIVDRQVTDLYNQLRYRQVPVVLFQVLRRLKSQQEPEERKLLSSMLSPAEASRFVEALSRESPHKQNDLTTLANIADPIKRSAFYFGLETFGKDFLGLDKYVKTRLTALTSTQKQILGFLSIAHHYAQRPIKAQAFAGMIGISKNHTVSLEEALPEFVRVLLVKDADNYWRTIHDLIALEIIKQLLSPETMEKGNWQQDLSCWAKDFAYFCRGDNNDTLSIEMLDLVSRAFIYRDNFDLLGTERSANNTFAHLIEDIVSSEGKIDVLRTVADLYPDEAHFWAHLGRFYAVVMSEYQQAIMYIDRALSLQWEDHVLHHMKGMSLRYQAAELMHKRSPMNEIIKYVELASESFKNARSFGPEELYGYISEIEMLVRVLDYVGKQQGNLFRYLQLPSTDTYLHECLDRAEELFEQVRRKREGEEASFYEDRCKAGLNSLYGDYKAALEVWDNLLNRRDTVHPPIRRQIVWTHLRRRKGIWKDLHPKEVRRIIDLLEENLREEPYSDKNLSLWVQAVRRYEYTPSIEAIIERIGYWNTNSKTLDSAYYLYVVHMLQVLDGSIMSRTATERFMKECKDRAADRLKRNRTKSLEWLGSGKGIGRLVHHSELGEWDKSTPEKDFWEDTSRLVRVKGRISKYNSPQSGAIEVEDSGIEAFFVPARGNASTSAEESTRIDFTKDDVNTSVDFYLGFSYDGLRAWEVKAIFTDK